MVADLVLGVDCSTTACKAIVFDAQGKSLAQGRASLTLDNPAVGAWQQDAEQWWSATLSACCAALAELDDTSRVGAMCITHQRETFVLTDDNAKPLHPALVWMDARCVEQVEQACEQLSPNELHTISGKPPCTTPSLYKLMFLLEQQPDLRTSLGRMLDVHAFLVWRLSGRCATSLACADPLGLVDMAKRDWSEPLLSLAGLVRGQLPELVGPGEVIAQLSPAAAEALGLPAGLPLVAGAGDGQSAGLGAGIVDDKSAYLNLGTAIVSGVLAEDYHCDLAFRTLFAAAPDRYLLETDLHGGTFTVNWLIDRLLKRSDDFDQVLAELEQGAGALPVGAAGLMLLPYWSGVMNPHWDADASGLLLGLRGHHQAEHVFRALLEGIAFEQRLHTSGVEQAAGPIDELVVMGGGAKSALWCQILADVMNKPVVRSASPEATALGAGILAAVVAGLHPDIPAAAAAMSARGQRFVPGDNCARYEALYSEVYQHLFPSLRDHMKTLARLCRA